MPLGESVQLSKRINGRHVGFPARELAGGVLRCFPAGGVLPVVMEQLGLERVRPGAVRGRAGVLAPRPSCLVPCSGVTAPKR